MITGDQLEQPCLGRFRDGGGETAFGPDLAHEGYSFTLRVTLPPKLLSGELLTGGEHCRQPSACSQ